jgi:hypothetical protein
MAKKKSNPETSRRYRQRHPDRVKAYEQSAERKEKKRLYAIEYRKRKKKNKES